MNKSKIWIGLLVLFLSGVLIGSVGTRIYIRHKISGIFAGERPVIRDLFFRRLTRQLDLTAEQKEEIEQIADRAAEAFHTIPRAAVYRRRGLDSTPRCWRPRRDGNLLCRRR